MWYGVTCDGVRHCANMRSAVARYLGGKLSRVRMLKADRGVRDRD